MAARRADATECDPRNRLHPQHNGRELDFPGRCIPAGLEGQQLIAVEVNNESDIENAFATLVQRGARGLLVGIGPLWLSNRDKVTTLAARHGLPTMYSLREFVASGGLMSYGSSISGAYRQVGIYAGRILKGEKPTDLPVVRATKFEFVINLKTAQALALEIPDKRLALADEVIE